MFLSVCSDSFFKDLFWEKYFSKDPKCRIYLPNLNVGVFKPYGQIMYNLFFDDSSSLFR